MNTQACRSHCTVARWHKVLPSCLDIVTSLHLFRLTCVLCKRVFEGIWKFEEKNGLFWEVKAYFHRKIYIWCYLHVMVSPGLK